MFLFNLTSIFQCSKKITGYLHTQKSVKLYSSVHEKTNFIEIYEIDQYKFYS